MARLEDVAPKQVLYQRTASERTMMWRNGVNKIRVEKVQLEGERGVVASWNNRAPRFFPENRVEEWLTQVPH